MRRPLPFEAEEMFIKAMFFETCRVLSLWGDEFLNLGMNKHWDDYPHEILVELMPGRDADFIIYEDMLVKGSKFWEWRYDIEEKGFYFTIMHYGTKYTVFSGESIAKTWQLEFARPYLQAPEAEK